jgi:DNA polymerase-3 subunit epsilon
MILFYDTETTGLPLWEQPSDNPLQPHIVQLAALLVEPETKQVIQSMNVIIKPEGWEIPAEVTAIHGITTEYAAQIGIPESVALKLFLELWSGRTRIGHVQSFDARIIRIATKRYCEEAVINAWKEGLAQCTGELTKPVLQMPAKTRGKFKTPKLTEAYRHFFQKELQDAHTALADATACMEVFFAIGKEGAA